MRLIDADELKEKMLEYEITIKRINKNRISNKEQVILLDIGGLLDNAPTIDAVPVVRCKDCKWADDQGSNGIYCLHLDAVPICSLPDGFCSFGVRKETEHEVD